MRSTAPGPRRPTTWRPGESVQWRRQPAVWQTPRILAFSDDLVGDDGMPDQDKLRAAIDDPLTKTPHLASTRVAAMLDKVQGHRRTTCP